jgi:hypothetical protein
VIAEVQKEELLALRNHKEWKDSVDLEEPQVNEYQIILKGQTDVRGIEPELCKVWEQGAELWELVKLLLPLGRV